MKSLLRKWRKTTVPELHTVIPDAFKAVLKTDIRGWFTASGYCCSKME